MYKNRPKKNDLIKNKLDKMKFTILTMVFCVHGALGYTFENTFSFGTATSAYQIEGAWNVSKGFSYWDYLTHNTPFIANRDTGDDACKSYYKIDEDVKMLRDLGVKHYRFSIAWTRIYPTGLTNGVNEEGVAYYNELIDKLLAAGIEPWVTIYHWDTPYGLVLLGGFYSTNIVDPITAYADVLFQRFGDRVKTWVTINEPQNICVSAVDSISSYSLRGVANYICGHNILRAHGSIYRLYQKKYKRAQRGRLSMAFSTQGYIPATDSAEDIATADRINQFSFGWFVHPLIYGDYPKIMKDTINRISLAQNFSTSRLPKLSCQELRTLKGSLDFIGLNNYDSYLVSANSTINPVPSVQNDYQANIVSPAWNTSYSIEMRVKGFGRLLKWIKDNYKNPEIIIMEQGVGTTDDSLGDTERRDYMIACLNQVLESINVDKVRLTGYTYWSLMDNFEWTFGYTVKYGLYHVNFNDPERARTPRNSAVAFSFITKNKTLEGLQ